MDRHQSKNHANEAPNMPQFKQTQQSQNQNVRHIPIYVEGRDEPIFNKHLETVDSVDSPNITPPKPVPAMNDLPKTGSLFDRVKNFPVRVNQEYELNKNPMSRGASPARPLNTKVNSDHQTATSYQQESSSPPPELVHPIKEDSITKIKKIQKEVLELMGKVEHFDGLRKDRDYAYLDEMLTQNLLKLDVIDSEGNDNIKFARREAIKCINKCIEALEAKAESNSANKRSAEQQDCKYSTSTAV